MSSGKGTFAVTAKNKVAKGKVEKVTLKSTKNPGGVKYFLYKRDNKVGFAQGDMGASVVSFKKEEVALDEAKYELYHKDFSSAMQHAYKMAKKLHGITVKPSEIDDKVASGPRKPSEGKTNTYRLKGDKGAIQVQVYNKGGNKPYELNFYKEEVEIDEALPGKWPAPGVKKGTRKDLEKLEKELQAAKKKKDKEKAAALQKELERLMKSGKGKKIGPSWMHKEEIELEEGWFKDLVDKKRAGAKAASKKSDTGKPPVPKHKPEKPKPSIIGAIKDVYGRLFNGDFIGMTAYLNTLNEDQSSDQIAVVIGDINETELTLINPENLDQTTKINLENLQVDINEDGELEISEAEQDWRKIRPWNTDRYGKKIPVK